MITLSSAQIIEIRTYRTNHVRGVVNILCTWQSLRISWKYESTSGQLPHGGVRMIRRSSRPNCWPYENMCQRMVDLSGIERTICRSSQPNCWSYENMCQRRASRLNDVARLLNINPYGDHEKHDEQHWSARCLRWPSRHPRDVEDDAAV